jgi:Na+-transporting methylmalonyl-CoA/oxaloacetate decarboxylase gamma subunit
MCIVASSLTLAKLVVGFTIVDTVLLILITLINLINAGMSGMFVDSPPELPPEVPPPVPLQAPAPVVGASVVCAIAGAASAKVRAVSINDLLNVMMKAPFLFDDINLTYVAALEIPPRGDRVIVYVALCRRRAP